MWNQLGTSLWFFAPQSNGQINGPRRTIYSSFTEFFLISFVFWPPQYTRCEVPNLLPLRNVILFRFWESFSFLYSIHNFVTSLQLRSPFKAHDHMSWRKIPTEDIISENSDTSVHSNWNVCGFFGWRVHTYFNLHNIPQNENFLQQLNRMESPSS